MDSLAAPNIGQSAGERPDARPGGGHPRSARGRARARSPTSCGRPGCPGRRPTGSRSRSRSTRSWCATAPVASGWAGASWAGCGGGGRPRARRAGARACSNASARRPGRARSCTCARATSGCVSRRTSARPASATRSRCGATMPLTKGSGGRVLLAWAADRDRFDVDAAVLSAAVRPRDGPRAWGSGSPGSPA